MHRKESQKEKQNILLFIILITIFILLLFWGNYQFAKGQPGGTDFLYRWLPTRLVYLENYLNPYSPAVEYQVELMHIGHARQGNEIPGMFSYPYYTMLVFLPFAFIENFLVARAAWMTVMEFAHLSILLLTLKMIKFNPSKLAIFALLLFSLFNADFAQALIDGNPSSLAALFAILALFFISRRSDILAGIFLALSTIKPQLVILFFAMIWLWAASKQRWRIIYSSLLTLILLLGISFVLLPSWLSEFIKDLTTYTNIASPSTPNAILSYWMPSSIAAKIALAGTTLSILIVIRTIGYYFGKDFSSLFWSVSLIFIVMPLTGITSAKSNYITMLPGVILLFWHGYEIMKIKEFWLISFLLMWIGLSWFFFYAGRNWVVNDRLIYFVDFYPLPILLLILFFLVRPFKNRKKYSIVNINN